MTTLTRPAATTAAAPALAPALLRACAVEARKLVDTRTGWVLTGTAVLLSGAFAGGRALFPTAETGFAQLASVASYPAGSIAMVMAVLLVAGEFAHTAPVTFTLEPRRGRVVAAKALVVVALAVVATALAFLAAGLVMLVAPAITGDPLVWTADGARFGVLFGNNVFVALAGFALALAFRNAPAPLVVLLVWPTVALLVASLSEAAGTVVSYLAVDPFFALLTAADGFGGARVATATLLWISAPAALGAARLVRADL